MRKINSRRHIMKWIGDLYVVPCDKRVVCLSNLYILTKEAVLRYM